MRGGAVNALATAIVLWAGPAGAQATLPGSGGAGLDVAITMTKADGTSLDAPRAGQVMRVEIAFSDALAQKPVTGLFPRAWVRRLAPGALSCGDAAWMVRASGTLAADDFPLDGRYLVSLGHSGPDGARITVTDLAFRLGVANTISVTPQDGTLDAMVLQGAVPRALLIRREAGEIAGVDLPMGGLRLVASGLSAPADVVAFGKEHIMVVEEGRAAATLLDGQGARIASHPLDGPPPFRLHAAGSNLVVAASGDGSAFLIDWPEGVPVRLPPGSLASPYALSDGLAVSAGQESIVLVRWLDDPARSQPMAVPFHPEGIALTWIGERPFAILWRDEPSEFAVLDLSSLRLVHRGVLDGAVVETARAATVVFLAHRSGTAVTVVDLGPVPSGGAPFVRRVDLPAAPTGTGPVAPGRLVSLAPEPMALYVPPGADRGYRIAAGGGLSNAPMSALRIQGDLPEHVAVFDRGLAEIAPGRFEAMVNLPRGGNYQVVTTTGPGGTTACAGFFAEGEGAMDLPPTRLEILSMTSVTDGHARLELRLANSAAGAPDEESLAIWIHDLGFGVPRRVEAFRTDRNTFTVEIPFKAAGRYVLTLEAGGGAVEPAVLDIARVLQ